MITLICILVLCSIAVWLVIGVRMHFIEGTFPPLNSASRMEEPYQGWPFVSVIVPGRNEERDVKACLESLATQDYPNYELIFVDDESTDRTLVIAQTTLEKYSFARAIAGSPRPTGKWIGKSWALVQGVEAAKGDWLLFIDSDVVHHPQAIRKAMAMAIQMHVDALSIMPAIECVSFWEKIIMPLFALLSTLVEPMDRANHPDKHGSRLSGAFILIKRKIYEEAGGHRAISDQILEDMALAQNLKKQERNIWLTYTTDLARTRMYDSFRDLWLGLNRLSFPMMKYSLLFLAASWVALVIGALAPWLAIGLGLVLLSTHPILGSLLLLAGFSICMSIPVMLTKLFRVLKVSRAYAWLLPMAALVYCLAGTSSAFRHYTGRGLGWKQRTYS
jgi:chlorobactene glucosyltransferase